MPSVSEPSGRLESARAPLEGTPVASRRCPAPGCGRALTERQTACSGRCRAAISRERQRQAQAARDAEVKGLLEAALRRLAKL